MMKQWFYQGFGWGISMISAAAVVFLAVMIVCAILFIVDAFMEGWKSGGDDDDEQEGEK